MGLMKRLNYLHRVEGVHLAQSIRVFAGLEPPPPERPSREELAAMRAEARTVIEEVRAEREAIEAVEREAEAERLAAWRADVGDPMPPQADTGYYRCANLPGAFFTIGSGPWPDYRPKFWAPEPSDPAKAPAGKLNQGRLFS